jgi:hypothetical protein
MARIKDCESCHNPFDADSASSETSCAECLDLIVHRYVSKRASERENKPDIDPYAAAEKWRSERDAWLKEREAWAAEQMALRNARDRWRKLAEDLQEVNRRLSKALDNRNWTAGQRQEIGQPSATHAACAYRPDVVLADNENDVP